MTCRTHTRVWWRNSLVNLTIAVVGMHLMLTEVVFASTSEEKCTAQRLDAVGQLAQCRMRAEATSLKLGEPAGFAKCQERFEKRWARAEARGGSACLVIEQATVVGRTATAADALAREVRRLPAAAQCGNGTLESGEDCDVGALGGATCVSRGFTGGTLSCASGCVFETGGCWTERFVDNRDGTITDNLLRLMWEKKIAADGVANTAEPHDADNRYRWSGTCALDASLYCQPDSDAAILCHDRADGAAVGCGECAAAGPCLIIGGVESATAWSWAAALNSNSFGGHTDWRIPTRYELDSIFDHSTDGSIDPAFAASECGTSCVAVEDPACSCWPLDATWSATTSTSGSYMAWWVGPFSLIATNGQSSDYRVRAVRNVP